MSWLMFLAGTTTSYVPEVSAQAAVPVHREPRHRLVWEAGPVRVLDVQIPPGDTSLYHVHDSATLYVPIATSTTIIAQTLGGEWSVGRPADTARAQFHDTWSDTVYAYQPQTHRGTNVGTSLYRVIAVTNAQSPSTSSPARQTDDLPGNIEQNSSWFLQRRVIAEAGSTSTWYTSQLPLVIVQPTVGTSIVEHGPSLATKELAGPGSWVYLPAGARFRFRNPGGTPVLLILVQTR